MGPLIDAALIDHFLNVGGRRVVALADSVNRQPAAPSLRAKRVDGKPEMLRGIFQGYCVGIGNGHRSILLAVADFGND